MSRKLESTTGERGSEIVEFALSVSILMALVLGIVVFARAYNIYQTITRAAREGVREAVLPTAVSAGNSLSFISSDPTCPGTATNSPSTTIFSQYISPALQASSLNPSNVQNYSECVTPLDPGNSSSDPVQQCGIQVSFEYPVQIYIPLFTAAPFDVKTNVQMRLENQDVDATGNLVCGVGGS